MQPLPMDKRSGLARSVSAPARRTVIESADKLPAERRFSLASPGRPRPMSVRRRKGRSPAERIYTTASSAAAGDGDRERESPSACRLARNERAGPGGP